MVLIENVLTPEECRELIEAFEVRSGLPGARPGEGRARVEVVGKKFEGPARKLIERLRWVAVGETMRAYEYPDEAPLYVEFTLLARMESGDRHTLHADAYTLEGKPNHTPNRSHAAITYLNKCVGGALYLPIQGVRIEPRPGLMVGYPSTLPYQHEVDSPSTPRYTVAVWLTESPEHEEKWDA